MIKTLTETGFKWIDILGPTPEELNKVALEYGIHEAFISDVLQPEHLPKYEPVGKTSFFILRYYSALENADEDTIQGLTNKIAIFQAEDLVITIHRLEIDFINFLKTNLIDSGQCKGPFHLLNRLIKAVLQTYEAPRTGWQKKLTRSNPKLFLKRILQKF